MPHISYHLQKDVERADKFLAEPHRRWLINKCWDAKKCDLLQTLNCSLSISTFRHTLKCRPASLDPNVKLYAVEVQERRYAIPHVWCIHHMFWLQFTQHTLTCRRTLPKMRGRNAKLPPKVVSAMNNKPRMTDEEINEKEARLWTDANLAKEYALSILLAWFYRDGLQSRTIYGINLESKDKEGMLSNLKGALTDARGFMSCIRTEFLCTFLPIYHLYWQLKCPASTKTHTMSLRMKVASRQFTLRTGIYSGMNSCSMGSTFYQSLLYHAVSTFTWKEKRSSGME